VKAYTELLCDFFDGVVFRPLVGAAAAVWQF